MSTTHIAKNKHLELEYSSKLIILKDKQRHIYLVDRANPDRTYTIFGMDNLTQVSQGKHTKNGLYVDTDRPYITYVVQNELAARLIVYPAAILKKYAPYTRIYAPSIKRLKALLVAVEQDMKL